MDDHQNHAAFDMNQGHGNHWFCIYQGEDAEGFLLDAVKRLFPKATVIGSTRTPIPCDFDDDQLDDQSIITLVTGPPKGKIRMMALLATNPETNYSTMTSCYPECDGMPITMELTQIHEWANGCEATLQGRLLVGEPHLVSFVDTRYALFKHDYVIGQTYSFHLSAMGYDLERVDSTMLEFTPEESEEIYQKLGIEPEYDQDDTILPFQIETNLLNTLLQVDNAYPHIGEFRSPMQGRTLKIKAFQQDFTRILIGLAPSLEGPENSIPLYVRNDLLPASKLHKGDTLYGQVWLMGHR